MTSTFSIHPALLRRGGFVIRMREHARGISTAIDGTYARHAARFWAGRRAGRHQDSCECQQCCYRQLVPEGALQRW